MEVKAPQFPDQQHDYGNNGRTKRKKSKKLFPPNKTDEGKEKLRSCEKTLDNDKISQLTRPTQNISEGRALYNQVDKKIQTDLESPSPSAITTCNTSELAPQKIELSQGRVNQMTIEDEFEMELERNALNISSVSQLAPLQTELNEGRVNEENKKNQIETDKIILDDYLLDNFNPSQINIHESNEKEIVENEPNISDFSQLAQIRIDLTEERVYFVNHKNSENNTNSDMRKEIGREEDKPNIYFLSLLALIRKEVSQRRVNYVNEMDTENNTNSDVPTDFESEGNDTNNCNIPQLSSQQLDGVNQLNIDKKINSGEMKHENSSDISNVSQLTPLQLHLSEGRASKSQENSCIDISKDFDDNEPLGVKDGEPSVKKPTTQKNYFKRKWRLIQKRIRPKKSKDTKNPSQKRDKFF
ncbi:putative leucine-rich repeat-containing protein DDB_G0290503 [Parasteatoda tepidariorum]|uniref:putative leucine-rich repeat-containing protein DDB_G0290503 n=1 Tax=Parasteatoda tepidariorum TaxID=114398 RepID=UPI0039BCE9D0